jgi:hypothetical protein
LVRVLRDGGPGEHSYALAFWDGRPVLMGRWNGTDEAPIGNPQSRGLATWFVLDDHSYPALTPFLLGIIEPQNREFLLGFLAMKDGAAKASRENPAPNV